MKLTQEQKEQIYYVAKAVWAMLTSEQKETYYRGFGLVGFFEVIADMLLIDLEELEDNDDLTDFINYITESL